MNKKLALLILACALALAPGSALAGPAPILAAGNLSASPAEVLDISGRNYLPIVNGELNKATNSIHVVMYLMNAQTSEVGTLMDALISAHKRKLDVTVILDRSFKYIAGERRRVLDPKNDAAYARLARAGLNVRFAAPGRTVHGKLVVIDGHTVICGSANWSQRALTRNVEFGYLIRSPECAAQKLADIRAIDTVAPPDSIDASTEQRLRVPAWFLTDEDAAPAMMTAHDERAFDLFLLILRTNQVDTLRLEAGEEEESEEDHSADDTGILLSFDALAGDLGMTNMTRTAYRRQITKALKKLERRYKLIECEMEYNGPARVKLQHAGNEDAINIPSSYWDYGWCRTLDLAAKFAHLVCIYKTERSPAAPAWSESLDELAQDFHVNRSTIGQGLSDLAAQGLLQIEHSTMPPGGFSGRQANRYQLHPLPSYVEREKRWADMIAAHGESAVTQARTLAALMNQDRSPDVVADFLGLINQYGHQSVRKATRQVARKRADNPQRHLGYIVGILKTWEKQDLTH
jgi:hypothetical protein